MIIIDNILQRSDEWYRLRLGKITGSGFAKLLGTPAAKKKYLISKACEIVTQARSDNDKRSNVHMDRGRDYEDIVKNMYKAHTFSDVREVGLVIHNEYVACSPDGLVGDDGMIEIKVPDSYNYFVAIMEIITNQTTGISEEYYMQMQFNMFICGRDWCDYVLYNPSFTKINREMFIYRVYANLELRKKIEKTISESIKKIKLYVEQFNNIDPAQEQQKSVTMN